MTTAASGYKRKRITPAVIVLKLVALETAGSRSLRKPRPADPRVSSSFQRESVINVGQTLSLSPVAACWSESYLDAAKRGGP